MEFSQTPTGLLDRSAVFFSNGGWFGPGSLLLFSFERLLFFFFLSP